MKNIIVIESNSSYLQFIINLNKSISRNRNFVFDGGSLEMMIADVLGPLYQIKNLMMATAGKLSRTSDELFEKHEVDSISEYEYNLAMDAEVFVANQEAKILVDTAFERYKQLLSIIVDVNPELFAVLPTIDDAKALLLFQKTYSTFKSSVITDDKTIQMFG